MPRAWEIRVVVKGRLKPLIARWDYPFSRPIESADDGLVFARWRFPDGETAEKEFDWACTVREVDQVGLFYGGIEMKVFPAPTENPKRRGFSGRLGKKPALGGDAPGGYISPERRAAYAKLKPKKPKRPSAQYQFRMRGNPHMVPEYFEGEMWFVENEHGEGFVVPTDVVFEPDEVYADSDDDFEAEFLGQFSDYIEGSATSAELQKGWWARLQAPGYTDAEPWHGPFSCRREAMLEIENVYDVHPITGEDLD